jgi:hypothetical protein
MLRVVNVKEAPPDFERSIDAKRESCAVTAPSGVLAPTSPPTT